MDNKEIGKRIKTRRKELNLTLKEIAEVVGVASSTIQRYESGFISQHKLPVLQSIAKAINVNPTWLVREDAPMETGIPDEQFIEATKTLPFTMDIDDTYNYSNNIYNDLSSKEKTLLSNYNKLNDLGKDEAIKRVSELTEIYKYTKEETCCTIKEDKSYLEVFAAHDREGEFSEEDIQHDLDIMNDENF